MADPGPGAQWRPSSAYTDAGAGAGARRRGMVISVVSPKGGTGKSTLALNLASYLGLTLRPTGRNVCLVDANFQQADAGKYLGTYEPNIVDLSQVSGPMDPATVGQYLFNKREAGISALLGPATPFEAIPQQINGKLYSRVVSTLREMYSYIIVDTPVAEFYHDIFDNFVLPESDFLVVTVAPNFPTLQNADMWLRTIHADRHAGGHGFPEERIGILLNRQEEGIDCDEEEVRLELGMWRFLGSIPETSEWKRANNNHEIVATKNYQILNRAFAEVLYHATGDPTLAEILSDPAYGNERKAKRSLFGRRRVRT